MSAGKWKWPLVTHVFYRLLSLFFVQYPYISRSQQWWHYHGWYSEHDIFNQKWKITRKGGLHTILSWYTIARAWCKTIVTNLLFIACYNSFALSPLIYSVQIRICIHNYVSVCMFNKRHILSAVSIFLNWCWTDSMLLFLGISPLSVVINCAQKCMLWFTHFLCLYLMPCLFCSQATSWLLTSHQVCFVFHLFKTVNSGTVSKFFK